MKNTAYDNNENSALLLVLAHTMINYVNMKYILLEQISWNDYRNFYLVNGKGIKLSLKYIN